MGPIVFCPNGHVFESRAIRIENSRNITFRDFTEICPFCGAMAEIMDGTFDFMEGTIRVLSAPQTTVERLRSIRALVRQTPPDKVLEAIRQEAPELAASLARFLPKDPGKIAAWIAVILMVIQVLIGMKELEVAEHPPPAPQEQQLTPQQIEQIIRSVIDSEQPSSQPALRPAQQRSPPILQGVPPMPPQPPATQRRPVPARNKRYTPPKRHQNP